MLSARFIDNREFGGCEIFVTGLTLLSPVNDKPGLYLSNRQRRRK